MRKKTFLTKICEFCNNEFQIPRNGHREKRFCNNSCASKWKLKSKFENNVTIPRFGNNNSSSFLDILAFLTKFKTNYILSTHIVRKQFKVYIPGFYRLALADPESKICVHIIRQKDGQNKLKSLQQKVDILKKMGWDVIKIKDNDLRTKSKDRANFIKFFRYLKNKKHNFVKKSSV